MSLCLYLDVIERYLQITPSATSFGLTDQTRYPRVFKMLAPDTKMVPARIAIMEHLGWKKVALVHQGFEIWSTVSIEAAFIFKAKINFWFSLFYKNGQGD